MATKTVGDWNEEGKREAAAALDELRSALVETVSGQVRELAARLMESSGAAVVDGLIRETMLEAGRRGLEQALEADRSDCGAANAPQCGRCGGGRMRYLRRERSATETALGTVRVAMGRYLCESCRKSARPREARLDIEASMTPTARRMASELGSACCYAEVSKGFHSACEDLRPRRRLVVHAGNDDFPLPGGAEALSLPTMLQLAGRGDQTAAHAAR